jgi:hypothetical protein
MEGKTLPGAKAQNAKYAGCGPSTMLRHLPHANTGMPLALPTPPRG